MISLTASPDLLRKLSGDLGQHLVSARFDVFPTHRNNIQKGRLRLDIGIVSLYLPVIRGGSNELFTLDKEWCTRWKDVVKFNTCQLFDGTNHNTIQDHTSGRVSNLIQGLMEFKASVIDAWVGVIAYNLYQQMKPADFTGNADRNTFEGGGA